MTLPLLRTISFRTTYSSQYFKILSPIFSRTLRGMHLGLISLLFSALLSASPTQQSPSNTQAVALFAGGCFWCMEKPFDVLPGVSKTISGYTGGHLKNPSYEQISGGGTGHYEAIQITYDPTQVSYQTLLEIFWKNIDPTDASGQFCDKGKQYRSGIFYLNEQQKLLAEQSQQALIDSGQLGTNPLVTEVLPAQIFYPAEKYHQNYYQNNPLRYNYYRYSCGRDKRLEQLWGKNKAPK